MQEEDPTAIDPDEPEELPAKPPIENMPPEEGHDPPTDQEEHDAARQLQPMDPSQAAEDPTVDDQEHDEAP